MPVVQPAAREGDRVMPRRGGRPIRRASRAIPSLGGVRGLAISIDAREVPMMANQLAQFTEAFQRRLMRTALTKSARPVRNRMVQMVRTYSAGSRRNEAVGATQRAIIMKVQSLKRDPSQAYAIIGVRRRYEEMVETADPTRRSNVTGRRVAAFKGGKHVGYRALKNIGPIARKARLNPKRTSKGFAASQRRRPDKYFHLIDTGARHIRRVGRFLERANASWDRTLFMAILQQEVDKAWGGTKGRRAA